MTVADSITSALRRFGRSMVLRRKTWNGNDVSEEDVTIYGVTDGPLSFELTDGTDRVSDLKVTFANAQIAEAEWPGPPQKLDELIIDDGQPRTITAVETKYLGPQVLVFVANVQPLSYDRYITIQRFTATADDYGEQSKSWTDVGAVLASKVDVSGSEDPSADQLTALVVTRFRVRWSETLADLSPLDRIVYEGQIYDIKVVKELQLKVGIEIFATARADD